MKVLIFGDSNTASLKAGYEALAAAKKLPRNIDFTIRPFGNSSHYLQPFFEEKKDHVHITRTSALIAVKRLPSPGEDYDAAFFSGTLNSTRLWRYRCGAFSPLANTEGKAPISSGLLRRAVQDHTRYLLDFMAALKRHGVNIHVVEGPRPFRHHDAVRPDGGEMVQFIDRFYRSQVREALQALDVPAIDLPAASYDRDGFTLDKYRHDNPNDQHHANAAFGKLAFQEIAGYLQKSHKYGKARSTRN